MTPSTSPAPITARELVSSATACNPLQFSSLRLLEHLDATLARLVGTTAARKLITLAFERSRSDTAWMLDLHVPLQGNLQAIDRQLASSWATHGSEHVAVLVGHLLDLLHALIGTALTDQLLKDAWPLLVTRPSRPS